MATLRLTLNECPIDLRLIRRSTQCAGLLALFIIVSAANAYHQSEFMTSTDERFRPVNLINGPDGCLYVVDLYRGLIQHRLYLTTFLRKQTEESGNELDKDTKI